MKIVAGVIVIGLLVGLFMIARVRHVTQIAQPGQSVRSSRPLHPTDVTGTYVYDPRLSHINDPAVTGLAAQLAIEVHKDHTWDFADAKRSPQMTWYREGSLLHFRFPGSLFGLLGGPVTAKGLLRLSAKGGFERISRLSVREDILDFPVYRIEQNKWYIRFFVKSGAKR